MESPTTTKRVRNCNWDEDEKKLLKQLVMERIDIIENKNTTTNTNSMKKASWEEILLCFNTINKKKRDVVQLVNQWRSMKNKLKTAEFTYRRARVQTGGGPPPPSPPPEDIAVMAAMPNEFVVDSNVFDSDSLHMVQISDKKETKAETEPILDIATTSRNFPLAETTKVAYNGHHLPSIQIPQDVTIVGAVPGIEIVVDRKVVDDKNLNNLLPNSKSSSINTAGSSNDVKFEKKKKNLKQKNIIDFEEEIFLLTKRSKERAMEREEELHLKKLQILDLEKEFWNKKVKKDS